VSARTSGGYSRADLELKVIVKSNR
jgi:hypothetical protein